MSEPARDDRQFDKFLQLTVRARLIAPAKLETLLKRYREEFLPKKKIPDTLALFSSFLVSAGVLTVWQCQKLREGRWKGFFLDDYFLLDRMSYSDDATHYLARCTKGGAFVELRVFPPSDPSQRKVNYEIVREIL
jgi:hypothetical protein